MERRLTSNIDYCESYCENNSYCCSIYSNCINRKIYEKLKDYEDSDDQGLIFHLPCKVGTTVFEIENNTDACSECNDFERGYYCDCEDYCVKRNIHDKCVDVCISNPQYAEKPLCEKHFYEITKYIMNNIDTIFVRRNEFGKTIFFTYEGAKAKLAEMEGVK